MAYLHETLAARDAFTARYRGMPWVREIGIGPSGDMGGYRVQVSLREPVRGLPRHVRGVAVRYEVRPALPPLGVARWAWSGRPEVFAMLDANGDGLVDTGELADVLGEHALRITRGESSGSFSIDTWPGSPNVFHALD